MIDLKSLLEHKYSCLLLNITEEQLCNKIFDYVLNIPEELIIDFEDEFEPHLTLFYGIHFSNSAVVKPYIKFLEKNKQNLEITLGKVNKFSNEKYDVIYIEVLKKKIFEKIHNHIKLNLENTTQFDFNPHITLAYVYHNSCDKLLGDETFLNIRTKINTIKFSSNEKNKTKKFYI